MWNAEAYQAATGILPGAPVAEMESALLAVVQSETDKAVAKALLCRDLKAMNWKGSDALAAYGLGNSVYTESAARGEILWLCGDENAHRTWLHIRALGKADGILTDTYNALLTMQADGDKPAEAVRREWLCTYSTRRIISEGLGENATPERIDTLTDKAIAEGMTMPSQVRKALPALAKAAEIKMAEPKRRKTDAPGGKADTPTITKATDAMDAFTSDRAAGGENIAYTAEEVAAAWGIINRALKVILDSGAERYAVADEFAALIDDYVSINGPIVAEAPEVPEAPKAPARKPRAKANA